MASSAFSQAACSELFFSEIVEGTGNNKAIEIYNPTANPVALSNYRIVRCSNGSSIGTDSLQLTGTVAAHDVWIVANGQTTSSANSPACDTALQNMADQLGGAYPDPLYENGNDAILLVKISPYSVIDIFGKIGENPGQSWSDVFPYTDAQGTWWTKDHTLIRKSTVTGGNMVNPTAFNVTTEWDSLPVNTWSNLGVHNSTCSASGIFENGNASAKISVYPNPAENFINVNANSMITEIRLYNMFGELVSDRSYGKGEMDPFHTFDLNGISSGLYLLEVRSLNGITSAKISVR